MGEERDKLIRRLGEAPVSDQDLSDQDLVTRRTEYYADRGRLPPEIEAVRNLLVGYGTLMSRDSVAGTVGDSAMRKPFLPVVVSGYQRLFNLRPDKYQPSFFRTDQPLEVAAMNVTPLDGARFNGLAFPVTDDDLAALDERERYYERVWVPILAFEGRREAEGRYVAQRSPISLGNAWVYSAGPDAPAVFDASDGFLPHWRDVVVAREGAYAVSEVFGKMFDQTTYMPDGRTLVAEEYRDDLPDPGASRDV
jgi:hypothetical protein